MVITVIASVLTILWILNQKMGPANGATGTQFVSPVAAQAAGQLVRPPIFTPAPQNNIQPEPGIAAQRIGLATQMDSSADVPVYVAPIAAPGYVNPVLGFGHNVAMPAGGDGKTVTDGSGLTAPLRPGVQVGINSPGLMLQMVAGIEVLPQPSALNPGGGYAQPMASEVQA